MANIGDKIGNEWGLCNLDCVQIANPDNINVQSDFVYIIVYINCNIRPYVILQEIISHIPLIITFDDYKDMYWWLSRNKYVDHE